MCVIHSTDLVWRIILLWHEVLRILRLGCKGGFISKRGIYHNKFLISACVTGSPHFATIVVYSFANFYFNSGLISYYGNTTLTVVLGMYKNWPAAILSAVELPKIKFPVLCIEQHQGTSYLAAHHHDETYKTQLGYDSIMAPTY